MFQWGIRSLTLSSGDKIEIENDSTLIILGPNNCGKSTVIREVVAMLDGNSERGKCVHEIEEFQQGSEPDLLSWLKRRFVSVNLVERLHSLRRVDRCQRVKSVGFC